MSRAVQAVTDPKQLIALVGLSLDEGGVNQEKANVIIGRIPTSYIGKQYLEFACQIGVLYKYDSNGGYDLFRPSRFGRHLFTHWLENPNAAVAELLGTIPQYRLQVELTLTELLLAGIARNSDMSNEISALSQKAPWFLERMAWFQDMIGWRDASSFNISQLTLLKNYLQNIANSSRKTYGRIWGYWDDCLGFGGKRYLSNMTKIEKLGDFLASTRQQPLHVQGEILLDEVLKTLILLIIAKNQHYALSTECCAASVNVLLRLGIDIRQNDGNAYLLSAVELTLPHEDPPYQSSFGPFNLPAVDNLLTQVYSRLNATQRGEITTLDLYDLFQYMRSDLLDSGFFTSSPFADNDDVDTQGVIQLWKPPSLADDTHYDFFEHLLILGNNSGRVELPLADVFLNKQTLAHTGDVHYHFRHTPHFGLLLLLLYDVGGAAEHLALDGETWHYNGFELISTLDKILNNFGFQVWDEGYRSDPVKHHLLGRELVNLACRLGVAQVNGAQLVEKEDGPQAGDYYYKAFNVITRIKEMGLFYE